MGQDPGEDRATVEDQASPEELRRDIRQTREQLGETAAALAEKTDVKAQAKAKVEDLKQAAAEKADSLKRAGAEKAESVKQAASEKGSATPGTGNVQSAGSGLMARASAVAAQARTKAQENPVAAAAGAAFIGGVLVGRRRSR